MLSTIKSEFKMMFARGRLNRLRYFAYSSVMTIFYESISYGLSFLGTTNHIITAILIFVSFLIVMFWGQRRLNDSGRSLLPYAVFMLLGIFLIFLPPIMLSSSDTFPGNPSGILNL